MTKLQLHDIVTPHDHDVLSGRGNFVNYHTGNEHFRALVRKHKVAYVACPKPQKGKFSKMIVDEIRSLNPPGRFLKQDPGTKLWNDIGEKKALDKTRQALREGAPEIMKELSPDLEDSAEEQRETESPPDLSPPQKPPDGRSKMPKNAPDPNPVSSNAGVVTSNAGVVSSAPRVDIGGFGRPIDGPLHPYESYNMSTASVAASSVAQNALSKDVSSSVLPQNGMSATAPPVSPHIPQHNMIAGSASMVQPPPHVISGLPLNPQNVSSSHSTLVQQSQLSQVVDRRQSLPAEMIQANHIDAHSGVYSRIDALNPKLGTVSQTNNYHDELEPRHFNPTHSVPRYASPQVSPQKGQYAVSPKEPYAETEPVAPLPPRRVPVKLPKRELKKESSEGSLQIDTIFHGNKEQDSGGARQRMSGSSAHLSVMSLSMSDMQTTHEHQPVNDPSNVDSLAPMFNNSLRLGGGRHATKAPPRRIGSSDAELGHNMDMSVATLGSRLSEFGDEGHLRMSESQANMSFSNVFEETERELVSTERRHY